MKKVETFEVLFHLYAYRDRFSTLEYQAQENPNWAILTDAEFYKEIALLEREYRNGDYRRILGVRKWYALEIPYTFPYIVRSSFIIVLRLMHQKRLWPEKQLRKLVNAKTLTVGRPESLEGFRLHI